MRTGLSGLGHDACTAPETPTVQLSSTPASVYVPSGKSGVPASSTTLQLAGTMPVSSAAYCAISELQEEKNVVHSAWHGRWGSEPGFAVSTRMNRLRFHRVPASLQGAK